MIGRVIGRVTGNVAGDVAGHIIERPVGLMRSPADAERGMGV